MYLEPGIERDMYERNLQSDDWNDNRMETGNWRKL